MMFLLILGGGLLMVFFIVGYFAVNYYHQYRRSQHWASLEMTLPPLYIKLEETLNPAWQNAARITSDQHTLKQLGFEPYGNFRSLFGFSEVKFSFWYSAKRGITAVLTETLYNSAGDNKAQSITYSVDIYIQLLRGNSITVTSNDQTHRLPRPDTHQQFYFDVDDIQELISHLSTKIPAGSRIQAISHPVRHFKHIHSEISEWLWQEAQLRSQELLDFAKQHRIKITDEYIADLVNNAKIKKNYAISDQLIQKIAEKTTLPEEQWEAFADRLVIIHDAMSIDDLHRCLYDLFSDLDENEETQLMQFKNDDSSINSAIAYFHTTLKKIQSKRTIIRIARQNKPIEAEIYLRQVEY